MGGRRRCAAPRAAVRTAPLLLPLCIWVALPRARPALHLGGPPSQPPRSPSGWPSHASAPPSVWVALPRARPTLPGAVPPPSPAATLCTCTRPACAGRSAGTPPTLWRRTCGRRGPRRRPPGRAARCVTWCCCPCCPTCCGRCCTTSRHAGWGTRKGGVGLGVGGVGGGRTPFLCVGGVGVGVGGLFRALGPLLARCLCGLVHLRGL